MKRMLKLTVRARSHDKAGGRSLSDSLLELFQARGISGATVIQGVKGFGSRGAEKLEVLGLSVNLPIVIETVGDHQRIEGVLGDVKKMVGDNGLITLEDVNVF